MSTPRRWGPFESGFGVVQRVGSSYIFSPSDLGEYLLCEHLVTLEFAVANGELERLGKSDPAADLLRRRGDEHEQRYLESLRQRGLVVAEITMPGHDVAALREAELATQEAMTTKADVIYQASFFDGRWRGHADFLERVDTPSDLGSFSYEVVDTKLARHAKVEALLQVSNYSEQLARLQGRRPSKMHLLLGDETRLTFSVSDFDAYYRVIKESFEVMVSSGMDSLSTYPHPISHCAVCEWADACLSRRKDDDHLSLVAGMRQSQIAHLHKSGILTLTDLGTGNILDVPGVGAHTLDKLHHQARLQLQQRETDEVSYELLDPGGPGCGLARLPAPSEGDLFFDMEGDPYVGKSGIEYLFGVVSVAHVSLKYESWWGHDSAGEKRAFEQFIDFLMARLDAYPDLHVYHYAPYETTAMKRLAGRHGTREAEVDDLLRREIFSDLYQVVRQGIRISQDSYSIKKLEPLYMGKRQTDVVGGAASILAYENWLELKDQSILDDIEAYNRDDCESTYHLRNWLEDRRGEAVATFGDVARPVPKADKPSPARTSLDEQIEALRSALAPQDPAPESSPEQHAQWLLAQLLEWHRRENKAEWWRYFELLELSESQLVEDREALGGLTYEGVVAEIKQSRVHRYRFDPAQEYKLTTSSVIDPRTERSAGTVVGLDEEGGTIDLRRAKSSDAPHPTALIPTGPIQQPQQRTALLEIARDVADNGMGESKRFGVARDLLSRTPPRLRGGRRISDFGHSGHDVVDVATSVVVELDASYLAVQGPPGSGKTYAGAEMVLALVRAGKRVGITANSHKVVDNLLSEVARHASENRVPVRMMQKVDDLERFSISGVRYTQDNGDVVDALSASEVDVVGGTAWLFARTELRKAFDVLIVDEAGQVSLADVLAISTAASSVVLLGDPQQLAQPSKGIHPEGAEVSALAHLVGSSATISPELGLLLDRTWRMHPDICEFVSERFYDGRLTFMPQCAKQRVLGDGYLSGVGLRYLPVESSGNRTSSTDEALAISQAIEHLIGLDWINARGEAVPLRKEDILVVTPYNAQVVMLKRILGDGPRVGTVDKFQGQEAAVVFYSLAASSPQDISRGMKFLYSLNRLNVAVSRARCISVLVCSPALLPVVCRTPEQARLANALCRFVEMAAVPEQDTVAALRGMHG